MKFSKVVLVIAVAVIAMLLTGPVLAKSFKVAMVLPGNISDKSWNQAGYEGLMKVKNELGFEVAYSEKVAQPDQAEAMADYARRGYDVVIGHGGEFQEAANHVARKHPETLFVVDNGSKTTKNVAVASIDMRPVGYLMGFISGKMTKTGKVGYISATKIKQNVDLGVSYEKGFKAARSNGTAYTTWTNDWDDIAKGKEAALSQISQGADVIFPTMDNATIGSLQAVKEKEGVYAMGMYYDAISDWPDIILNSAIVNWSQALFELFAPVKQGQKLEGKKYLFDLNYSKVLNIGTYHSRVPDAVKKEVSALMEKLKSGEIKP
jgi:basic membrane protein A